MFSENCQVIFFKKTKEEMRCIIQSSINQIDKELRVLEENKEKLLVSHFLFEKQLQKFERPKSRSYPPRVNGLILQELPEKNDSLYRAVSTYLGEEIENFKESMLMRVENSRENFSLFFSEKGSTIDNYIHSAKCGNIWEDSIEMHIITHVLDRPIIVIDEDGRLHGHNLYDDNFLNGKDPVFVYFDGCTHYNGFLRDGTLSGHQIFNQLVSREKRFAENEFCSKIPNI